MMTQDTTYAFTVSVGTYDMQFNDRGAADRAAAQYGATVTVKYPPGKPVVVSRPGRLPFTGTVAHSHTAPGYVAVLDDRYRSVSNYPCDFVSHAS